MSYICPLCKLQPLSHSLKKILEKKNIVYYYTCPSQALLYYDVNGIIHHYNGVFSEIPENKQWVWIFDSVNFTLKHATQINVAIELAKLISNKFSNNLKKIIIINPTLYTNMIYKILIPFLHENVKNVIEINYDITSEEDIISYKI
jgi:hypothetical protein